MAVVGSNSVTGITTAASGTDAVYRGYLDDRGQIPPVSGNVNEYLTTNGTSLSWEPLGGYTEYTTGGTYTYTIPTSAKFLTIHAIGAGGGGAAGNTDGSSWNNITSWYARTACFSSQFSSFRAFTFVSPNVFVGGTQGALNASTTGIIWFIRTAAFGSNTVGSVGFLNSLYVAAGSGGVLNTSTNSVEWTMRTCGFAATEIFTTAFGAGVYVAAGASGRLNTSTNAIHWTLRTGAFFANAINQVIFESPNFLGVSNGNVYNSSTNGINWVFRTSGFSTSSNTIKRIIFANSLYLKCGQVGKLNTSTNGIQWVLRTSGLATQQINGIAYSSAANAYFCVDGTGRISSSTNAIEWTLRTSTTGQQGQVCFSATGIADFSGHDSGSIVMSPINPSGLSGGGGGSGASASWQISRDQISGSTITVNVGSAGTGGVAGGAAAMNGNNTVINWVGSPGSTTYALTVSGGGAGSNTGALAGGVAGGFTSPDQNYYRFATGSRGGNGVATPYIGQSAPQATTAYQTTGAGGGGHASLAASPMQTGVLGGGGGGLWYNGSNLFATDAIELDATPPKRLTGALAASGASGAGVQIGNEPAIWTSRTCTLLSGSNAVRFNFYSNLFFASSGDGGGTSNYSLSTNAVIWILRSTFAGSLVDNAFGNSTYVVLQVNGEIKSSTDSIVWTARTSGLSGTYRALSFGGGVFVAASETNNGLASSTNAIVWTLRTNGTPSPNQWVNRVRYLNSNFLLTGWTCLYSVSTNAINWTTRTLPGSNVNVFDFTFGSSLYVAAYDTRIAVSTDAIVWNFRTTPFSPGSIDSNNGIFIATSTGNNEMSISTDTIVWLSKTYGGQYKGTVAGNNIGGYGGYNNGDGSTYLATAPLTGSARGAPAAGVMGSGGSGGSYDGTADLAGNGGNGSPGYVRIEWK
jgi:hypothetical protein